MCGKSINLISFILVLGLTVGSVSAKVLVWDDFEADTIDLSKWQLVNGSSVSITQDDGQVFFDRPVTQLNYLVTAKQFDPAVTPLTIVGSVTLGPDADMDVWTRADIVANTGDGPRHVLNSGIRINFWQDAVDAGWPPNLDILEKTAGVWPWDSEISGGADILGDDEALDWDFVITDDGTKITASFTQTSNPFNTLSLFGMSTTHFNTNYIALTVVNGYLNEVVIAPLGWRGFETGTVPKPADKVTDVLRDVNLGWKPGVYADKHNVYLGTVFDDVNNASTTEPLGVLVSQGQEPNAYDPDGLLDFGQTYYWRVDEVNDLNSESPWKGDVWSFTVEPRWYSIPGGNITASASSSEQEGRGPENTINGSGLDADDLHTVDSAAMWMSAMGVEQPVWLKYEFDKIYKLYEMWVWNYNAEFEDILGFGLKDVTIEYSENGTDWTALGDFEFAQGPGLDDYAHNTAVDFGGLAAKYVRITANSHWGELPQYGLSEVRFFYRPVRARQPNPAPGQTGVTLDAMLSWRAGREAVSHEVYVSDNMEAVINGTALVDTVSENSFALDSLDLELGKTYYWKINEVNEAESPGSWDGDVWNFTTIEYLIVDDFESYDDLCNRIFYSWQDGLSYNEDPACGVTSYAGNNTGSTVGNLNAPFAERTIVHEGRQSMPFGYDNSAAPYYSEAQRRFDTAQDWTKKDVKILTLYFYGDPGNAVGQIYVKLNGSKVVYDGDASQIQEASWNQWDIDLASFGVDLLDIRTLSIGVGNGTAGGSGILYIDDLRLYR